jgi:hypothetical protein
MRAARMFLMVTSLVIPVLETIRRWDTWREYPAAMFDDYVIGAVMLWVAWVTRRERPQDRTYLAAAIGVGLGIATMSTMSSVRNAQLGIVDPSGLGSSVVATIKGGFVLVVGILLASVLRKAEA